MSILVKGMEMPKNCCECWFMEGEDEWCCAHRGRYLGPDYRYAIKDKPDWCPLVEVPPHGRLIDADALIAAHKDVCSRSMKFNLDLAPTVIPASEEAE